MCEKLIIDYDYKSQKRIDALDPYKRVILHLLYDEHHYLFSRTEKNKRDRKAPEVYKIYFSEVLPTSKDSKKCICSYFCIIAIKFSKCCITYS